MLAFFLFDSSFAGGAMIVMTIVLIPIIARSFGCILKWLLLIGLLILLVVTNAIFWIPVAFLALTIWAGIVYFVREKIVNKRLRCKRKVKKVLPSEDSEGVEHTEKTQGSILDYILVAIVVITIVSSVVMLMSNIVV